MEVLSLSLSLYESKNKKGDHKEICALSIHYATNTENTIAKITNTQTLVIWFICR